MTGIGAPHARYAVTTLGERTLRYDPENPDAAIVHHPG